MSVKSYFTLFRNNKVNEFSAIAPSPQRDYHQFLITTTKFIWRWWKITARNDGAKFHPGEIIDGYEDFVHDDRLHSEIRRIFDKDTLDYAIRVAGGCYDILPRLPQGILMRIFVYLNLEDIVSLGYTSKALYRLCNDETLWQELYRRFNYSSPTDSVSELAETFGWKRVFFTNKLQLQLQLRRVRNARAIVDNEDNKSPVNNEDTLADCELPQDNTKQHKEMKSASPTGTQLLEQLFPPEPTKWDNYVSSTIAGADDWNDLESEVMERSFFEDTEEEELKNLKYD